MPQHTATQPPPQWEQLAISQRFRALMREKKRFIVPATAFFLVYYFALPILVGYYPELMKRRIFGPINIAYAFALSQFLMAWALAWVYIRAAGRFDKLAAEVIASGEHQAR